MAKNLKFKRCSKAQWKEEPKYTCFKDGREMGRMFFSTKTMESPYFVFDELSYGCFTWQEIRDLMHEIVQKMRDFEKEVLAEGEFGCACPFKKN